MDKGFLTPSGDCYESDIEELEDFIFSAINMGAVRIDADGKGYVFKISELPFEIDRDEIEQISEDIQELLTFRIESYNESLNNYHLDDDEEDNEDDYASDDNIKVLFRTKHLYVRI